MLVGNALPRRYPNAPGYICSKHGAAQSYAGPTGFHWLIEGVLGGTPRPGIVRSVESDAVALQRVNTKLLVTLNDNWEAPAAKLAEYGIVSHQVKIIDMRAPEPEVALELCQFVDGYLQNGSACIYHCKAGRGRTGTMLAAQLIYYGRTPDKAIKEVQFKNPKWIESQVQIDFLHSFESFLA